MFSLIFDEMPNDNYFYIGGLETLVSEDYENYQEYEDNEDNEDYENNKKKLYYDELLDYYDSYYDDYNDY
jgi:hypothetical protein|uniref:Uncharacterized protein n=1 Tax=viral metagenome TaxID=1070528 RepID=A0A6C0JR94_9ZZZZ